MDPKWRGRGCLQAVVSVPAKPSALNPFKLYYSTHVSLNISLPIIVPSKYALIHERKKSNNINSQCQCYWLLLGGMGFDRAKCTVKSKIKFTNVSVRRRELSFGVAVVYCLLWSRAEFHYNIMYAIGLKSSRTQHEERTCACMTYSC